MTRPRAVTATFLALGLFVSAPLAAPLRAPAQDAAPAAPTRAERPPAGTWRRGVLPLPAVVVAAAGALVVLAAGAVLAQRTRKRRR